MGLTTYIEAIRQGIWEEMERDENVFVLGEDVGVYGGAFKVTAGMLERFGEWRVIDTPISESAIVGAAIGASLVGLRPVAEMQFADFIACAFDQITNFAAKCRYRWGAGVPMVVRGPCGGGVRGGPFHSQNPEMYFVHTPGLKVVAPATAYGAMLYPCLEAAATLETERGAKAEVIDLRSLLPLDRETIVASARKTGKVM